MNGLRVLDFGAGTGLLSEKMSTMVASIVALDPSTKMIEVLKAKQLPNVEPLALELTPGLMDENPLLQEKFDLIVASSALAFVEDFHQSLITLSSLLKDGASLVQWDWLKAPAEEGNGFSGSQIREAYQLAHLKLTKVTQPFAMESGDDSMPVLMAIAVKD